MVSTGGVHKHEVVQGSFGNMSRGLVVLMPVRGGGGLQVKHTLVQGRCLQIDACPGCTLKPVPGGADKMDACPGMILHIVPGGYVRNYCHL